MEADQKTKAEEFRALHHNEKLLILPNIWDVLSAKTIEATGLPAAATGSIATAMANGYGDGEKIPFVTLLHIVHAISGAISIPLTVDIERGFAEDTLSLKTNIRMLIESGAAGINIEDGKPGKQGLDSIDDMCTKIRAIRNTADECGVPIVINARMDIFLQQPGGDNQEEAVIRTREYLKAGADCIYPIMIDGYEKIESLIKETKASINVNLTRKTMDLKTLQDIGVSRVSLGPGFLFHALGNMHKLAKDLQQLDTRMYFEQEPLPKGFLENLIFQ